MLNIDHSKILRYSKVGHSRDRKQEADGRRPTEETKPKKQSLLFRVLEVVKNKVTYSKRYRTDCVDDDVCRCSHFGSGEGKRSERRLPVTLVLISNIIV